MNTILKVITNFWFCLGMAVLNIVSLANSLSTGENPWWSVLGVVVWVYLGWRSTRPIKVDGVEITPEQSKKIREATRRFSDEVREILKEKDDEQT